jgi:hypothetical protein
VLEYSQKRRCEGMRGALEQIAADGWCGSTGDGGLTARCFTVVLLNQERIGIGTMRGRENRTTL